MGIIFKQFTLAITANDSLAAEQRTNYMGLCSALMARYTYQDCVFV